MEDGLNNEWRNPNCAEGSSKIAMDSKKDECSSQKDDNL